MKIAILGTAHPLRGGLAAFNERLAYELLGAGHKVDNWSFSLQYPNFLFPGKTQYTEDPAPAGLNIITALNSVNPFNWVRVGLAMRKAQYDIIVVKFWLPFMGPAFGTVLRLAKTKHKTKVVCIVDNMIPHEHRFGDKMFTQYFIPPIDGFVAMSKEVLKDIKTFTTQKALFTPHPIYDSYQEALPKEVAATKLGLNPNHKYLLFFGFIRDYKGLDILLEAMGDPRIKAAGIHLVVAGEYYDKAVEAHNNALIAQHSLSDTVHLFTDFIPNSEVRNYFSLADVVVQPYKTATQSGITQIAFHFEKPMVVTNVGGLAEVVPHGKVGFVTQPNPSDIATAILEFYAPGSLPNLQEDIKTEKQKYTWSTFTKALLDAIA